MVDSSTQLNDSDIDVIRSEVMHVLNRPRDASATHAICTYLIEALALNRYFVSFHQRGLSDEWSRIRRQDGIADFMLDMTAQLRWRLGKAGWDSILERIFIAYQLGGGTHCVIDQDTHDRLANRQAVVRELLNDNPWYLTLIVLFLTLNADDQTTIAMIRTNIKSVENEE